MECYMYDFTFNIEPIHPFAERNIAGNNVCLMTYVDGKTYVAFSRWLLGNRETFLYVEDEPPEEVIKRFSKIGRNVFGYIYKFKHSKNGFLREITTASYREEFLMTGAKLVSFINRFVEMAA